MSLFGALSESKQMLRADICDDKQEATPEHVVTCRRDVARSPGRGQLELRRGCERKQRVHRHQRRHPTLIGQHLNFDAFGCRQLYLIIAPDGIVKRMSA